MQIAKAGVTKTRQSRARGDGRSYEEFVEMNRQVQIENARRKINPNLKPDCHNPYFPVDMFGYMGDKYVCEQ